MGALVVYESMFGNTEAVARAIGDGLRTVMPVEVVEVTHAPALADVDTELLVVGGPTHAFGLSRPETRRDAYERTGHPVISDTGGVREWLGDDPQVRPGLRVAAFDTHTKHPNLPGHAGRAAEKRLREAGAEVVGRAETFYVHGYEGPLFPGEVERAREWGEQLGALVGGAAVV